MNLFLSAVAGIITGIAFIYKDFCFLTLFSLLPFLYALKDNEKNFLKGLTFAVFLYGTSMSFLFKMHPMEFMGFSGIKSIGIIFLMYLGILIVESFWGGFFSYFYKKYVNNIYLFPLCYVLYEVIISVGILGLTFSHLYLPWYKNLYFIQSASLLSSYFLTLIIVYINVFIYKFLTLRKLKFLIFALLIFVINLSFGALRFNLYKPSHFKHNIALIQGNLSSLEKWESNSLLNSFNIYSKLSIEAKEKYQVDSVVWPETVINVELDKGGYWYNRISEFSKENRLELFTGCFYPENNYYYNSLVAFNKNGEQYLDIYHKRHLIPFAEKVTFGMNGLVSGKDATILNILSGKAGGIICIDSAYPHLTYVTKLKGSEYFLLITNDSWFEDSFGVESHFAHSIFRAVENNSYLLRTGNTGITAVITPKGEIKGKLEPLTRGYTVIKGGKVYYEKK
ncbi:MAG: apolipoprotein N-acyltransferase [Clostridia bacterium]|nr:apolipoprotein N-acyltransferase [Clostridia bacterium]